YQDKVGGLIGNTTIESVLTEKTNMNGVAYGNVFANNPNSENVSFSVGSFSGAVQDFYGTKCQLLNGMPGQACDEHTCDLLTQEEIRTPQTYTGKVGMGNQYDYSYVVQEYMPHLYYEGTTIEFHFRLIFHWRQRAYLTMRLTFCM
ncbi:MAG TPA: hypothetical protein PLZ77_10130, partial [Lachnospiraceae bacterium]|nr:hypothetical protein [Lachnospiraceae bacterium]